MSHKSHESDFHLGPKHLIRLTIFIIIYLLIIQFLTTSSKKPLSLIPKLPSLYQLLPQKSRQQLDNINQNPNLIFIQNKVFQVQNQLKDFPQQQIKDFQKWLIKSVSQQLLKNLEP